MYQNDILVMEIFTWEHEISILHTAFGFASRPCRGKWYPHSGPVRLSTDMKHR